MSDNVLRLVRYSSDEAMVTRNAKSFALIRETSRKSGEYIAPRLQPSEHARPRQRQEEVRRRGRSQPYRRNDA